MNCLVTGGAGFIGSHVVDKLISQGHQVVVVDNFNDYYNPEHKRNNLFHLIDNPNLKVFEGDIIDKSFLESVFSQYNFDAIIHLAARAGVRPSIADPMLYQQTNILGTYLLYELARDNNIKKFIFASSSSVYGERKELPFSEDDRVDKPISPYAATKKAGEEIAYTYYHLYGINSICLRFFTVYGERGRPDMAPWIFTEKILRGEKIEQYGDGTSLRDFTYIDDIVGGIISSLEKVDDLGFEIINLGNGKTINLSDFIGLIGKLTDKDPKIEILPKQQGDVTQTQADVNRAKELLGYEPKITLEEGMKNFIKWYKENFNIQ